MIRRSRFVIAVRDLRRSVEFYRDVLGFRVLDINAPGWAFVVRDEAFIMVGECKDVIDPRELGDHSYFAYLEVDDVDELHDFVTSKGATVIKDIRSETWGMREFGILTLDGHRIMFGAPESVA